MERRKFLKLAAGAAMGLYVPSEPVRQRRTYECQPTAYSVTGYATYYSREGCVGCSPSLTMRNGRPLNDSDPTFASNDPNIPMTAVALITNLDNGKSVAAQKSDTGGFGFNPPDGQIADLTIKTRDSIGGGSRTRVRITLLSCELKK